MFVDSDIMLLADVWCLCIFKNAPILTDHSLKVYIQRNHPRQTYSKIRRCLFVCFSRREKIKMVYLNNSIKSSSSPPPSSLQIHSQKKKESAL